MILLFLKSFLIQLAIFLVIPFLGWGLGGAQPILSQFGSDLALFFQNPARVAYVLVVLAAAVTRSVIEVRICFPSSRFPIQSELQHWRNIAFESILVMAPFSDRRSLLVWGESPALSWLGVILFVLGIFWNLYAIAHFLQHQKQQPLPPAEPLLLVNGAFRYVRHPLHLGMLVYSLGMALLFRSWIGLVMLVFMLNFILMRIREDEKHSRLKYGLQWAAYIKRSWRLMPRVY